jgi:hypothetical protein
MAAGQVTGIAVNIGALAAHPALLHRATVFFVFTTKVVVASVSLLIMVWAFIVSALRIVMATAAKMVRLGEQCVRCIMNSLKNSRNIFRGITRGQFNP